MCPKNLALSLLLSALVVLAGCASKQAAEDQPMVLKSVEENAPPELKTIETVIEKGGCLKAEEVVIHASRNYEWDVSLSGNDVQPQKSVGDGEHESSASGNPRAMFRNLDIRAWQRITFRKSGYDVVPFIRITARGRAIFIENTEGGGKPKVHRADAILIRNAEMRLVRDGRTENLPGTSGSLGADNRPAPVVR